MASSLPPFRVGFGYDIHPFEEGRPLVLGGITLPSPVGLKGHSDADCLTHAIADSILGAAGCADIGVYFDPSDPQWKGMDSQIILARAAAEAKQRGWLIANIDAMVLAEKPKLKDHFPAMQSRLAETLGLSPDQIGLKATTHEKLGAIGRGEGIVAQSVCLLYRS
jgi:2-C-methyl-D-erythritol 2,4-cyclodiphosphate synthase